MTAPARNAPRSDLTAHRLAALLLWRAPLVLIVLGVFWARGRGVVWSLALEWVGIACLANALRCGRVHCSIMGPSFMLLGALSLGTTLGLISMSWNVIWFVAVIVVAVAYTPELLGKRYLGQAPKC